MQGRIHSFQSFSTVDGPGIRSVVFLQGCPLRCKYCHNPETWNAATGTLTDSDSLVQDLIRLQPYIKHGGVTFSGGEALMQEDFLLECIKKAKDAGLHTCIDTSGCIFNEKTRAVYDEVDLVLMDVKMVTEEDYQFYTQGSLKTVIDSLSYLNQISKPVWIRQVIVEGLNDSLEAIEKLFQLLQPYRNIEKVDFLAFRKLCTEKYDRMKIPFYFKDTPETSEETIQKCQKLYHQLERNAV